MQNGRLQNLLLVPPLRPKFHKGIREGFERANEDPLWQALKAKRLELAREQGVPPYLIFHDSTLLKILSQRPQTPNEFGKISGVWQAKLTRYAAHFLEIINQ